MSGFTLIDSAQRSKDHSDTWAHPGSDVLRSIQVGYFVKVGVTHVDLNGERFWGVVKARIGDDILIQIDQDLNQGDHHGLADKDILLVHEENIFGIVDASGATVWEAK